MKFNAIFVLLAAGCLGTVGCAAKAARSAPMPPPATPQPQTAVHAPPADEPISVAQTNVVLPKPQPIQAEALAVLPPETPPAPEPSNQTAKPRVPAAAKPEPRQQAGAQTAQGPPPPPPPNPAAASRPRIRPVESPADQHRLLTEIGARQQQVREILAKAKTRNLSDAEKSVAERIQAFLDQTENALKDKDLQQAEALSNRALLLCPELNPGK
jgi:hypothetical protein